MEPDYVDSMRGQVNELSGATDRLGSAITAQGVGVSEKMDIALERLSRTIDRASAASDAYASKLEPISKLPEQHNDARELHEAKEVRGVVLPAN